MIAALSRKLRSQCGASLLLALLFLLLCSMVAASILMAAAANAGKYRSNQEEHQTYLALSSAISTLCDELNRCEYRGQYKYWEITKTQDNHDGTISTITEKYFQQVKGSYTYIADPGKSGSFQDILLNDFDAIFASAISLPSDVIKKEFSISPILTHQLTLTPNTGTSLDGRPISLTMNVKDSYAIYITAYLNTLPEYKVEAELTPKTNAPTLPASLTSKEGTQQTAPMQWKLGWITISNDKAEGTETGG